MLPSELDRKELEYLLQDPLLRDAPIVEGFKVLDPAVLYAKVGRGGMGAVYRGRHLKLDLDVAVKVLKPALVAEDADFVKRFEREARLAASIVHQNVVRVMDVHEKNGLHYIVMEFVRGETAGERVERKGPLGEKEALAIVFGATAGLAEAHARGIVHRDIKPANIMVSVDGLVKLADLGLAKSSGGVDGRSQTMFTSAIMGTPQYMPPEQWDTTDVTPAADVWALGATLWYLLAGREGILGVSPLQIAKRIQDHDFPTLRTERPDVRDVVHDLIERCVRRDPKERYPDAKALHRALRKLIGEGEENVLLDATPLKSGKRLEPLTALPRETLLRIRAQLDTGRGHAHAHASAADTSNALFVDDTLPRQATPAPRTLVLPPASGEGDPSLSTDLPLLEVRRSGRSIAMVAGLLLVTALGIAFSLGAFAPDDAHAALDAAKQKMARSEFDAAIADLERALSLDPNLGEGRAILASAFGAKARLAAQANDPDAAFSLVQRGLAAKPADPALEAQLGEVTAALRSRLGKGLRIESPVAGRVLTSREFEVKGAVDTVSCKSLRIVATPPNSPTTNAPGTAVTVVGGEFTARITVPNDGSFAIRLDAEDEHQVREITEAVVVLVDTADPVVTFTWPAPGEKVGAKTVVRGRVVDASACRVTVDSEPAEVVGDQWSRSMTLREGQTISVEAIDAAGRRASVRQVMVVDASPPELVLAEVPALTNQAAVPLRGTVKNLEGGRVLLDGVPLQPAADGTIDAMLTLSVDGPRSFVVSAADGVGNETLRSIPVRRHTAPPVLEWTAPDPTKPVPSGNVEVSGRVVSDLADLRVTVNGSPAVVTGDRWQARARIQGDQPTEVVVEAVDGAGNQATSLRRSLEGRSEFADRFATGIELTMVRVKPDTFRMGSPKTESGAKGDEPPHTVTISRSYWIGETEVTQKQWRAVMSSEPWKGGGKIRVKVGDDLPATYVTWNAAVEFCDKLTERERAAGRLPSGHQYCLPTEAEWEMACRAGSTTAFCFGADAARLGEFAVYGRVAESDRAERVRTLQPNAFGLFDMHGNVAEWCADFADLTDGKVVTDTYRDAVVDPRSITGVRRIHRGGGWHLKPPACRAAVRSCDLPGSATFYLGFRPVLAARPTK